MPTIISAWKMNRPETKAARYSTVASHPLVRPNTGRMEAATTMPVASPARQCISLFSACFQVADVKASWVPGSGLRQASR